MKALITGGTGFLGSKLLPYLDAAVVLTRDPSGAGDLPGMAVEAVRWDPLEGPAPSEAFAGVDAVFNLVGESIQGFWTGSKKRRVYESRVTSTRHLVEGMERAGWRGGALVSASAVGYYGDRGPEFLEETAGPGTGFLADLSIDWENEAMRARDLGVRVVTARIGLVLSAEGGALPPMLPAFRSGLGPVLGDGAQYWPWVHVEDVVAGLLHAAASPAIQGPINLTAPAAATNRVFTRALARALRRPTFLKIPAPLLRLFLGELGSVLLASQRVVPGALAASGYRFRYPELVGALHAVVGGEPGNVLPSLQSTAA